MMPDAIKDSIKVTECDENGDIDNVEIDNDVVILARYVPEGGWGWVVVFSAFLFNCISDGCSYSFGVLYIQFLEDFGDTKSNTSWIGSLFFSVPLLCGPVASVLCSRFGCRKITIAGGFIAFVGVLSSVYANSLETLYVTFGIIAGFGISLPYLASVLIISEHFRKKLALATGIAECGAGIGTIVFAPLIETLISSYGWRGTMLILSGIISNIIICGALFRPVPVRKSNTVELEIRNALLEISEEVNDNPAPEERQNITEHLFKQIDETEIQNYPFVTCCKEVLDKSSPRESVKDCEGILKENCHISNNVVHDDNHEDDKITSFRDGLIPHRTSINKKQKQRTCCQTCTSNLNLSIFRHPVFIMFLISNFILYFFYDVPFVFLVDQAVELNISKPKAALLISVIGVLHTLGNLAFGFVGDYRKISNSVLFGSSIGICGLAISLVPLFVDFIPLSVIGGVFGFLSASGEALGSILLVEIFGEENLCKSYGYTMFLKGIANLVGPPFAGWLYDISGSYDNTFYTTGGCLLFSGTLYTFGPRIHKYFT